MPSGARWGDVLKELRENRGWTHARFAVELAGKSRQAGRPTPGRESLVRMLRDWESGSHRPRDYSVPFILVYATEDELAARAAAPGSELDHLMAAFAAMGLGMDRRRFLVNAAARIAGVAAGSIALGAQRQDSLLGRQASDHPPAGIAVDAAGRPADPAIIGDGDRSMVTTVVSSVTGQYRRLEGDTPANQLIVPVAGHLQFARQFLSDEDSAENRNLAAALSEASGFAAWLSFDMRDHAAARTHYSDAVQYARRSRSNVLAAYMLGSMSYWAANMGNVGEAVRLVGQAKRLDISSATGTAWLATIEANAQAAAKDAHAAMAAIQQAERAPAAGPAWPWLNPFDAAKIAGYRGACHLRLDQPADAQRALREAISAARPAPKARALLLTDLADAFLRQHKLDASCQCISEAFGIGLKKRSEKVLHRVRVLRRQLDRWKTARPVRDLDAQLLSGLLWGQATPT
jgi:tetratricopeptide (TPR) repeat protein